MTVKPEDFVRAWQGAASVKEAATKLGMTEVGTRSRARYYRKKGVLLKLMGGDAGTAERLDVAKLNEVISHGDNK